IRYPKTFGWLW
nr:Chain C, Nef IW11 peptide from Protein Nef [Simian immunodeficiency virus]3RWD_F Chain F, Nef IW11 peptide from Protein Nef [Simian immunodeficiency virus]